MANKFYVYKWVDNNDNILYVGKTNDIDRRRKQHMSDKEWIDKSTILYYAELSNKTDMDIYEIYYINKYKPKYNKDYMNDTEFSLTLPELNFKIYEPVNIHSKMRTILFSHTVGFTGNNTKDCLLCLYEEVNFINDLKISNCYLYELIKNCKADFVKLFLDLYMIYEETDNEILLNKKKCMFFRCKKDIISLFTKIGVFDLRDNYYVFQKDILSYKYLDRLQENSAKILEQQNVDLNEVEYNSMETFIDKPFKSLQEFKEYKNNLND